MNMFNRRIILVLTVCIILLSSCKTEDERISNGLYYDIESIKMDISTSILKDKYDPEPFRLLQEEVMESTVDRVECIYRLKKILSSYNCFHLNISQVYDDTVVHGKTKILPFQFRCFGNDYYILTADSKYSKYLGWKLKGIGELTVEEAINKAAEYYPVETTAGKKYLLERKYYFEEYYYLGLSEGNKLRFTFEAEDGSIEVVRCKPSTWNKASIKQVEYKTDTSFSYISLKETNYGIKTAPEIKTLYIMFNKVYETDEYKLEYLFSDLSKNLKADNYNTIVFDIRYNGGGESDVLYRFTSILKSISEELQDYNIAIAASGRTYSAACKFIDNVIKIYPDVILFGEETGQAVFNYSYVIPNKLKNLNCIFSCPKVFDIAPQLEKRSNDIHRGTMPDVEVMEDFKGFIKGEDSIYKAIYEYFRKEENRGL